MSLIRVARDGPIRLITLNRPKKHNALTGEMIHELHQLFLDTPHPDERVTVIQGEGRSFCTGLELVTGGIESEVAELIQAMFDTLQHYPLPTIARVQGWAIAGGCELALHCDFTVAEEKAKFAMPLAQIGVATTWFLTKKIMETAGPVIGREFLLLGDPIEALKLYNLGVIARAVPRKALNAEVRKLTSRVTANAPLSVRVMKALIVKQMAIYDLPEHSEIDAGVRSLWSSDDALEGVRARVERRKPNFKGK